MGKRTNNMVVKSNRLVTASYTLTLNEIRLLDIALAELTQYEEYEKSFAELPSFIEVNAKKYAEIYGLTKQQAYTAMSEASEKLFWRYFTYYIDVEDMPSFLEERRARWVQEIGYIEGEGIVTLSFTNSIIELAGRLKSNFSRYHLEQKAHLTSIYAHRLYEMMLQWRGSKSVPCVSYTELRNRFDIDEHEYKRMSNFKARVLDPAVEQINELTDITVSYEPQKKGRRIDSFVFKFKFKTPKKTTRDPNTVDWVNGTTDNEAKKNPSWQTKGLTDKQINKIAIYADEFTNANSRLMSPSFKGSHKELIEKWRPLLKDPAQVSMFNMVQELLERTKS